MENSNVGIIGGFIAFVAIVLVFALFSAISRVDQDSVAVPVGGGWFDPDAKKVKGDPVGPGGTHLFGAMDKAWKFPAYKSPRFEDFEQSVTTTDGKKIMIKGQVAFRFVGEKDPKLTRQFAEGPGARKYDGERPGESDQGWANMLQRYFHPAIRTTLKVGIGSVYCADIEPSCRRIDPRSDVPETDQSKVEKRLNSRLQQEVTDKFGAPYLRDIRVTIAEINLPADVQASIDAVTSEEAKTKAAEQEQKTATAKAEVIRTTAKALKKNPEMMPLEVAKVCKGGDRCTIILDGTGNVRPTVNATR